MSQILTTLRSKGLKTKNCVSQTADFKLERGTRQGDPILAYIFCFSFRNSFYFD